MVKVRGGHVHGQVKVVLAEFFTKVTGKLLHPCPLCNIIGHLAADGLSIITLCGQGKGWLCLNSREEQGQYVKGDELQVLGLV